MIETGAFLLVDKGTNPNGAAATVKYEGDIYCFEASCPQCKVRQNWHLSVETIFIEFFFGIVPDSHN